MRMLDHRFHNNHNNRMFQKGLENLYSRRDNLCRILNNHSNLYNLNNNNKKNHEI